MKGKRGAICNGVFSGRKKSTKSRIFSSIFRREKNLAIFIFGQNLKRILINLGNQHILAENKKKCANKYFFFLFKVWQQHSKIQQNMVNTLLIKNTRIFLSTEKYTCGGHDNFLLRVGKSQKVPLDAIIKYNLLFLQFYIYTIKKNIVQKRKASF